MFWNWNLESAVYHLSAKCYTQTQILRTLGAVTVAILLETRKIIFGLGSSQSGRAVQPGPSDKLNGDIKTLNRFVV